MTLGLGEELSRGMSTYYVRAFLVIPSYKKEKPFLFYRDREPDLA